MVFEIQFLSALALDLCLGDPRWLPHPVKLIGLLADSVEKMSRKYIDNNKVGGGLSVVIIVGITGCVTWLLLLLFATLSTTLAAVFAVILLYLSIAVKDLILHAKEVYNQLEIEKDIVQARIAVGKIVGRDTGAMGESSVSKGCIESVAENMVDGITAPIFWAIICTFLAPFSSMNEICLAAIGALIYKSINTLDSMFGYRNKRYLHFGMVAAKLDDLVNWIPARISGVTLIMASFFLGLDWRRALRVFARDRLKHPSPNGGHSEAAVAGALGIKLGGSSVYQGRTVYKPTIGEATRRVKTRDILMTNYLVLLGSLLFVILMLGARQLILFS